MRTSSLLSVLAVSLSIGQSNAATSYVLDTVMWGANFFDNFNFNTVDLNHGYVKYLTRPAAQAAGLISAAAGASARISSDATTVLSGAAGTGRNSVRIESKKTWTHGLFVYNIAAMPAPACGVWPALWMLGANWPNNGEIDIIEGISLNTKSLMSLHSSNGCTVPQSKNLGAWQGTNCFGGASNGAGCGVLGASADTYGAGLNAAGGGVAVVEWTSAFVKIWWYNKKAGIPFDIANGTPDQTKRGTPQGYWAGNAGCNLDSKFKSNAIVINTNFCGDFAGNQGIWSGDAVCGKKAPTCNAYVAANPKAFAATKWLINSIKVYTLQNKKRGIEDPTLEFEAQARAVNVSAAEDLEQRDVTVETREESAPIAAEHMHRHKHRSERHI